MLQNYLIVLQHFFIEEFDENIIINVIILTE